MVSDNLLSWLQQSQSRSAVLAQLRQPSTALQLSRLADFPQDRCSRALSQLAGRSLVRCVNPRDRRSRLFWLTRTGRECQAELRRDFSLPPIQHTYEQVDWHLYGWVIYRHRGAVVKSLHAPMTPREIRLRAIAQSQSLRISSNNVRDVLRLLIDHGIVNRLEGKRRSHTRFELTELGVKLHKLLWRAEVPA